MRTPLIISFPDVAAQFDHARNGDIALESLTASSRQNVWWRCLRQPEHVWEATVRSRTRVHPGCPLCPRSRVRVKNSLLERYPHVAAQLDPELNDGLTADQISAGSGQKVSWRCRAVPQHVWITTVASRTGGKTGCPYCSGRRATVRNSLAALHPGLAAEMDPGLYNGLTADEIPAGSSRKIWWRCTKGPDHSWEATVNSRARGNGCPYCAGRQVSVTNSVATLYPAVAAELAVDLNDGLTADEVPAGSTKKLLWRCLIVKSHIWPAAVKDRTGASRRGISAGTGCPHCAGMRLTATNSLAARFPDVAAELAVDLNDGFTADQIIAGSGRRVWWRCASQPRHEWFAKVSHRTHVGSGCPDCAVYGYTPALPGFVYLLGRLDGREQRKIGISNVPGQRTAVHTRNGWRVLDLSPALAGALAFQVEQSFLAVLSAKGIRQTHAEVTEDRYDGYTEAWTYDDLPTDSLADVHRVIGWSPDPLAPE